MSSVELSFYMKEFAVPDDTAFTPEIERYLVHENLTDGGFLLEWLYDENRNVYRFAFCNHTNNGGEPMQNIDHRFTVTPWQVFSWAPADLQIFIPDGHEFKTIRLAEEYDYMGAGDPVEFYRMSDSRALGEGEVLSTKRTLIRYLKEDDVRDMRRLVGGKNNTDNPLTLLSNYYEDELSENTPVIVMHLRATTSIISDPDTVGDMANTASIGAVIKSSLTKPIIKGI